MNCTVRFCKQWFVFSILFPWQHGLVHQWNSRRNIYQTSPHSSFSLLVYYQTSPHSSLCLLVYWSLTSTWRSRIRAPCTPCTSCRGRPGPASSTRRTRHRRAPEDGSTIRLVALQGISKERFPGCVKLGEKVAFCSPTAGRRVQFFHPLFSQPGKHSVEIPCTFKILPHQIQGQPGAPAPPRKVPTLTIIFSHIWLIQARTLNP